MDHQFEIVTDSTCDLPVEELAELGVEMVPLHVFVGDGCDLDQIEIKPKEFYAKTSGKKITDPVDLSPEEEKWLGQHFLAETGSPLVFVTHYPSVKRPFYAMDDPENPRYTLSYDLLLHGLEITTGGQRIQDYEQQVAKMKKRHMDPADFENYLTMHKYGLPPHGGFGLGMERVVEKLLGLENIREAAAFPRDRNRLQP